MGSLPTFFTEDTTNVREGTPGRSKRLIERRNRLMCIRFYYHQKINSFHFAKCVENLYAEFFISQTEIVKILRNQTEYLAELRTKQPPISELKREYPWMNWS